MDRNYPVEVRARLDEPLSRWLWLVKWLLAIPHYIVLFFLWIAFAAVTVIAFFAILFTGRDPRPLFIDLVLLSAGGYYISAWTDCYPLFSPARSRITPPTLDIAYPVRLSAAWSWSSGGCWPSRSTPSPQCSPAAPPNHRHLGDCWPMLGGRSGCGVLRGDHAAVRGPLPARAV